MFRVLVSLACPALVLFAAIFVRAADVPVEYVVAQKELKAAVAGTVLTFSIHVDPACTQEIATADVLVEDVRLERISAIRPKGAPKPAKAARILATLEGVAPAGPAYLEVTGLGIAPVGGACQAQGSFAPAPGGRSLLPGTEYVLDGYECGFVILGVSILADVNDLIAFHIVDQNDLDVPSINNETGFVPGTIAKTSQGGGIAWGQVCNLSAVPKTLPAGWKAVEQQIGP